MQVKFWGCRGSIPVPDKRMIKYGGNTSCIEVDINGKIIIIDAGTGIRKLGEDLLKRKVKTMDMFITHSHWDHIQGFPFFKPIYIKDTTLNIFGCKHSYSQIRDILHKQMSYEFFPVRFSDLKSMINFIEICPVPEKKNGYNISTIQTNHPTYTLGIRIDQGKSSFVFITDNELLSEKQETKWGDFIEFCKGATYLVHDAQFTDEEYNNRKEWGHSTFEQSIKLACEAGVENLGFYHHDPDRKDRELDALEKKYKGMCVKNGTKLKVFVVKENSGINIK